MDTVTPILTRVERALSDLESRGLDYAAAALRLGVIELLERPNGSSGRRLSDMLEEVQRRLASVPTH